MFVASYIMCANGFDSSATFIFLGANYHTFTVGLHEYWRLFTCGFLHLNIFHLIVNMYSFYFLSRALTNRMNVFQFLGVLFMSIIVGSLTSTIVNTTNTLSVGISGGLFGLFVYYFIDVFKNNRMMLNYRTIILSVLPLILINFMSNVDVYGHLGGALCGMIMYFIFNSKGLYRYIYLCVFIALIGVLIYLLLTINTITPLYGGTDSSVVNIWSKIDQNYANKLSNKLMEVYIKYGQ